MRALTLRQFDLLWRILEPIGGRFCTTTRDIARYQALVDRGLARWIDGQDADGDAHQCRIVQVLPAGIRAFADFYAAGRMPELATLKPLPGGSRLGMMLPAACLDPNTPPPARWVAPPKTE